MPARPTRFARIWLGLVFGATACVGRLPLPGRHVAVEESTWHLTSLGRPVQVDAYVPEGRGRHPAAVVLHGSSGIHVIGGASVQRYAEALARQGVAAYVVHYFDATGTFTANDATEAQEYWRWVQVVRDAVGWVRARPEVRPRYVGLLGVSLGAYVGVGVAAHDPRIARVVLVSGGLEPGIADSIARFPPALLLHGTADDVVPLAAEDTLARVLTRHRALIERHAYAGEGHDLPEWAAVDVAQRAARFLADGTVQMLRESIERVERRAAPAPRDTAPRRIP